MRAVRILFIATAVLGVTLARCPVHAESAAYRECDIANGQRTSCGPWFQGKTVAWSDGAYRPCDIANGQIMSCGAWHQGKVVALHAGAYRPCDVANGHIIWCGAWYQGRAIPHVR